MRKLQLHGPHCMQRKENVHKEKINEAEQCGKILDKEVNISFVI